MGAVALYILMRNDMDSLSSGRKMAHASHASNAFVHEADRQPHSLSQIDAWKSATTQGFGTTIVLSVNEKEMRDIVMLAKVRGLIANVVTDPSYGIEDGQSAHFISIDTCAYVFGDRDSNELKELTQHLELA
tara:strand:- start:689 stop:1084 length:396 start_codon:yes stop_codon:yes gene_type:complete